jgi:hypothetical protein
MATAKTKVDAASPARVAYYIDFSDGYHQGPYAKREDAVAYRDAVVNNQAIKADPKTYPVIVRAEFSFEEDVPEGRRVVLPGEA